MSEYIHVEKPFLKQLAALGWAVIDQGVGRLLFTSSLDYLAFPTEVQDEMGYALGLAQLGAKHPKAKHWKGEGPGIFEIVEDHRGDTFRSVYTVRFAEVVYVLHAFQKKSKTGIKTPQEVQT